MKHVWLVAQNSPIIIPNSTINFSSFFALCLPLLPAILSFSHFLISPPFYCCFVLLGWSGNNLDIQDSDIKALKGNNLIGWSCSHVQCDYLMFTYLCRRPNHLSYVLWPYAVLLRRDEQRAFAVREESKHRDTDINGYYLSVNVAWNKSNRQALVALTHSM